MRALLLVLICSSAQAQVTVWSDSGHPPITIKKTSNQSTTSTSFSDITGLSWVVGSGRAYSFLCHVVYQSVAVTNGFAFSVNGPPGPLNLEFQTTYQVVANDGVGSLAYLWGRHDTVYDSMPVVGTVPQANSDLVLIISGSFVNGPADGMLSLRFKTEVAGSAITVKRGSWCTFF